MDRDNLSKQSTSTSNLGALDNMMPKSGSRSSSPPTPADDDELAHQKMGSIVTTPPTKEKKKLIFKKVGRMEKETEI